MTDRPILFSAPMVRALLDGRKTMTRRVLKPQPEVLPLASEHVEDHELRGWDCIEQPDGLFAVVKRVPCAPGNRLWVRESFHWDPPIMSYMADHPGCPENLGWSSSIHLPRVGSRITLLVDEVRVERLQEISEEDAIAEGVRIHESWGGSVSYRVDGLNLKGCQSFEARDAYVALWDSINAKRGFPWAANPWVAAIRFRVVRRNIDALSAVAT